MSNNGELSISGSNLATKDTVEDINSRLNDIEKIVKKLNLDPVTLSYVSTELAMMISRITDNENSIHNVSREAVIRLEDHNKLKELVNQHSGSLHKLNKSTVSKRRLNIVVWVFVFQQILMIYMIFTLYYR